MSMLISRLDVDGWIVQHGSECEGDLVAARQGGVLLGRDEAWERWSRDGGNIERSFALPVVEDAVVALASGSRAHIAEVADDGLPGRFAVGEDDAVARHALVFVGLEERQRFGDIEQERVVSDGGRR